MRRRYIVRGIVQGVNFRAAAADEARRLGLTGRIWNRDDGAVECVAEGDEASLARLKDWLGRGPRMARVERLEESAVTDGPAYPDFRVARGG